MTREHFQIYTVQITRKCICETFLFSLLDLILDSMLSTPPLLPITFLEKKPPTLLGRRRDCALFSYILPFLKASSLTSVVQIMAFQSKTT